MRAKPGPTLRAQWLGQQLRELREAAGMTLRQAAEFLERDPSTVSRFESAEYPIRRPDLIALLDFYAVSDSDQRRTLMTLREEAWKKGWWDGFADAVYDRKFIDYVWLESRAREIRSFEETLVPGLLQTRDYAVEAIRAAEPEADADQIDRWVELRMARQQVLVAAQPPRILVIMDEAILRRLVGGRKVTRAQLEHLLECAQRPQFEIRILPFTVGAHASPTGAFKVFIMAIPYPAVAYVESPAGALYVELPETDRLARTYDRLRKAALAPLESATLIAATAEDLQ